MHCLDYPKGFTFPKTNSKVSLKSRYWKIKFPFGGQKAWPMFRCFTAHEVPPAPSRSAPSPPREVPAAHEVPLAHEVPPACDDDCDLDFWRGKDPWNPETWAAENSVPVPQRRCPDGFPRFPFCNAIAKPSWRWATQPTIVLP